MLATSGLVLILVAPAVAQEPVQVPTLKATVNLVNLFATVRDKNKRIVGDLQQEDFKIYEDNQEQKIAFFSKEVTLPITLGLLIDTSGSERNRLGAEQEAAAKFMERVMRTGDAAMVISFDFDVNLLVDFTDDPAQIARGINRARIGAITGGVVTPGPIPSNVGGTHFYDAVYLASRELTRRDGRHVIVAVTDGGDTTSDKKYADAFEAAQKADAIIYPILVVPITNEAGRNLGGERALSTLASGTGGRVFQPTGASELDQAFTQILRDLRTQYLVAYYPRNVPADAPRFHLVKVELSRKDLRATTRTGYYGDATASR